MPPVTSVTGGTGVFTGPSDDVITNPVVIPGNRIRGRVVDRSSTVGITVHDAGGTAVVGLPVPNSVPRGYLARADVRAFIDKMVTEHGFNRADLTRLIGTVEKKETVVNSITRPAEAMTWARYRPIFMKESRVAAAIEFATANAETLARAQAEYGVPKEIILGIIGVETKYGANTGNIKVLESLMTLGFDYPKRAKFFRSELEHFLLLSREQGWDPSEITGSYAGAMGKSQFISSSYRAYAVDFDGDGDKDLWNDADAIGSVANYFRQHRWHTDEPIAVRAEATGNAFASLANNGTKPNATLDELAARGIRLTGSPGAETDGTLLELEGAQGKEHWVGLHNFYVITRYNRSPLYAMAVMQLSEAIAGRL